MSMIIYTDKFDRSTVSEHQKNILLAFFERRRIFDRYLKENAIPILTCSCCGFPTLLNPRGYEICSICSWQDDYQDDNNADEIWGGPNHLSLTESRIKIGEELNSIAEKLGGKINTDPHEVLLIIAQGDSKYEDVLKTALPAVDLKNIRSTRFHHEGQSLLWQLIDIPK